MKKTILVFDRDICMKEILLKCLNFVGYETISYDSPNDLFENIQNKTIKYNLAIIDTSLEKNEELIDLSKQIYPKVPVLNTFSEGKKHYSADLHLQKVYWLEEDLLPKVKKLLEEKVA